MDIEKDPDFKAYAEHIRKNVAPQAYAAACHISLVPEECDVKFAVELGLAIMYDKPLIAVIKPGQQVSEKMAKVIDAVVEMDMEDPLSDPTFHDRLKEAMDLLGVLEPDED